MFKKGDNVIWIDNGNKISAKIHHFSQSGLSTVAWLEANEVEVGYPTNPSSWYMAQLEDLEESK